jgi:GNAT superfamily N-acetyltransferase
LATKAICSEEELLMVELKVKVRTIRQSDIVMLSEYFPQGGADKHAGRFERQQRGEVTYLVAWHVNNPAGHALVIWQRPPNDLIASRVQDPCPDIEDLFVLEEMRSQGIATQILQHAEELARLQGYKQVGLSAGVDVDDPGRRLYERHGYVAAGWGKHIERGEYIDQEGQLQVWEDVCTYMIKPINS